MDEREQWISAHAAELRRVLADVEARTEVLALLGGDNQETKRQRRLAELEQELAGMEIRWRLGGDGR